MQSEAKRRLRRDARRRREALGEAVWRAQSRQIRERLLALDVVREAQSCALFWPMLQRREVDLRELDQQLRTSGHRLAYPVTRGEASFRWTEAPQELEAGPMGLFEPGRVCPAAPTAELGVVIVPALLLSQDGHRLGYGAGFYDRVLAAQRPGCAAVGVVFDEELVTDLPTEAHDQRVDWIVTDRRTLRC